MTELKRAAIRLHQINKLSKLDYKLRNLSIKYTNKGFFDNDKEFLQNRKYAVDVTYGLLKLYDKAVIDVQTELKNISKRIVQYASEHNKVISSFYSIGVLLQMFWDLFTALAFGH